MAEPARPLDRLEAALKRAEAAARTAPRGGGGARAAALETAVAAALARIDAIVERG